MSLQNLTRFPRLGDRRADAAGVSPASVRSPWARNFFIKRDDTTPLAMGATNCVSWSFSPPMRCARARIP